MYSQLNENQKLCSSGTVFDFTLLVMANPDSLYFCDTKHYNAEIYVVIKYDIKICF